MKKFIAVIAASFALVASVFAQADATPQFKFIPLLSGYNVLVGTNDGFTAGLTVTNVEFTKYNGQILFSLTTTNSAIPLDAFKIGSFKPNHNGDSANANASVVVYLGNTNQWVPIATVSNLASATVAVLATNWPIAASGNNQFFVGTNLYPQIFGKNPILITLYRVPLRSANGGAAGGSNPAFNVPETTAAFSFTVTANDATPVCLITNLPSTWMQGANDVYCTVTNQAVSTGGHYQLINQLGILQPQE